MEAVELESTADVVDKELDKCDVGGARALFVSFLRALSPTIAESR